MVGSVLMQRMREENDFAHIEPVFFTTSNIGGKAPDFATGAPAQASKRIEQWGAGGLQQRLAAAWIAFMQPVTSAQTPWLRVVSGQGRQAVEAVYRELLDGRTAPQDGHVLSLAE